MKPPVCGNCGIAEWRHVCAGAPINTAPINARAINEEVRPARAGVSEISANGRKREVYNAYMRGYMARRRGKAT